MARTLIGMTSQEITDAAQGPRCARCCGTRPSAALAGGSENSFGTSRFPIVAPILTDSPLGNDPELAVDVTSTQCFEESPGCLLQVPAAYRFRQTEHCDPRIAGRRKVEDMAEVQIESDETAFLSSADFDQDGVRLSAESLLMDKADIVTVIREELCDTRPEIFVQLDLHASIGMSK